MMGYVGERGREEGEDGKCGREGKGEGEDGKCRRERKGVERWGGRDRHEKRGNVGKMMSGRKHKERLDE